MSVILFGWSYLCLKQCMQSMLFACLYRSHNYYYVGLLKLSHLIQWQPLLEIHYLGSFYVGFFILIFIGTFL